MSSDAITVAPAAGPKVKKSVALSGVIAGNSAVCTVGRTGNDLHYRGYDIIELAKLSTFEEVAYLLIHGELPTESELKDYKKKLKSLRGLPAQVKTVLELIPAATHPMDVMRTGCSILGNVLPEKEDQNIPGAKDIMDRLIATFSFLLLYCGISVRTDAGLRWKPTTTPWPAIFCICYTAKNLRRSMRRRSTSP